LNFSIAPCFQLKKIVIFCLISDHISNNTGKSGSPSMKTSLVSNQVHQGQISSSIGCSKDDNFKTTSLIKVLLGSNPQKTKQGQLVSRLTKRNWHQIPPSARFFYDKNLETPSLSISSKCWFGF
jgi:hypothetical protein